MLDHIEVNLGVPQFIYHVGKIGEVVKKDTIMFQLFQDFQTHFSYGVVLQGHPRCKLEQYGKLPTLPSWHELLVPILALPCLTVDSVLQILFSPTSLCQALQWSCLKWWVRSLAIFQSATPTGPLQMNTHPIFELVGYRGLELLVLYNCCWFVLFVLASCKGGPRPRTHLTKRNWDHYQLC